MDLFAFSHEEAVAIWQQLMELTASPSARKKMQAAATRMKHDDDPD